EVLAEFVLAGLDLALAGAAGADPAVQRNVDALAVGGVGHGLAGVGVDEAGDPVFEIQCDLVRHAAPRLERYSAPASAVRARRLLPSAAGREGGPRASP